MKSLKNTGTKPVTSKEWAFWGSFEKSALYLISAIVFSISMFIDINSRNNEDIKIKDIYIQGLSALGFLTLIIFQIVNKWIVGLTLIGLVFIVNLYSLIDILKRLRII